MKKSAIISIMILPLNVLVFACVHVCVCEFEKESAITSIMILPIDVLLMHGIRWPFFICLMHLLKGTGLSMCVCVRERERERVWWLF